MRFKTYWPAALLVLVAGCNLDESKTDKKPAKAADNIDSPTVKLVDIKPQTAPVAGQYCYIKKVYVRNDAMYIDADYIQFLMDEDAVKAAKKAGEAKMDIDEKGDTSWNVLDDYYIVNDNPKIRTLKLAGNFEYVALTQGTTAVKKSAVDFLKASIKGNIFILTINSNGEVTKVEQQYVP